MSGAVKKGVAAPGLAGLGVASLGVAPAPSTLALSLNGTSSDFVNLNILAGLDIELEVRVDWITNDRTEQFGALHVVNGGFRFGLTGAGGDWYGNVGTSGTGIVSPFSGLHTLKINKTGFYMDGGLEVGWSPTFGVGLDLHLGAVNSMGSIVQHTECILYESWVRDAGVLIQHLTYQGDVLDQSGNGNDATLTGGTFVSA